MGTNVVRLKTEEGEGRVILSVKTWVLPFVILALTMIPSTITSYIRADSKQDAQIQSNTQAIKELKKKTDEIIPANDILRRSEFIVTVQRLDERSERTEKNVEKLMDYFILPKYNVQKKAYESSQPGH